MHNSDYYREQAGPLSTTCCGCERRRRQTRVFGISSGMRRNRR